MKKKVTVLAVAAVWTVIVLFAWFSPARENSDAERRQLAQMPDLSVKTLLDGSFMEDFEEYTLDQFPVREGFRSLKSLFHYYVLGQRDNNGIYIADGSAAQMEYPLDADSVDHALKQFGIVYDQYLQDSHCDIYTAVVPDKGYYLAGENGYLSMDYDALFSMMEEGMPWAEQIDLTDSLTIEDYYDTDLHWKQECLQSVAGTLAQRMDIALWNEEDFTHTALERPFYGVYCGQAALPMDPDTMYLLENQCISDCRVYNYVTDSYTAVYDLEKLDGKDLYDVYLSGPQSLLRIENPNAETDRELILFRDSFGSSLAPLLLRSYATITLVDLRYIQPQLLGRYLEFEDQDVLFLHSSLVLNKSLI